MKKLQVILLAYLFTLPVLAQNPSGKIKVILLGTNHFGATSDRNSTQFPDLFSPKRQKELDSIATIFQDLKVDKYFLETSYKRQNWLDSLYMLYKTDKLTDTNQLRNEIFQVGFRSAKRNNARVVAADFPQELPFAALEAYDKAHKNDTISPYPFFEVKYPFTEKRKSLAKNSLLDYYTYINGKYERQSHMYDYTHYALSYGIGDDFLGETMALSWQDRNLKIFTNILRGLDPKTDKTIVVLFGPIALPTSPSL